MKRGRPPINRDLDAAKERLARVNAGLLACYEVIEIGNRKRAAIEAEIQRLSGAYPKGERP